MLTLPTSLLTCSLNTLAHHPHPLARLPYIYINMLTLPTSWLILPIHKLTNGSVPYHLHHLLAHSSHTLPIQPTRNHPSLHSLPGAPCRPCLGDDLLTHQLTHIPHHKLDCLRNSRLLRPLLYHLSVNLPSPSAWLSRPPAYLPRPFVHLPRPL